MAARKRTAHDQKTRERIQASQLLNRLTDHVLGEVEMTATQVNAAKILLGKTLPDLSAVEWSGELESNNHTTHSVDKGQLKTILNELHKEY